MCSGNGEVALPFGSPQYLAIGALVLLVWVFIECFGSPFLRNIEIMVRSPLQARGCEVLCFMSPTARVGVIVASDAALNVRISSALGGRIVLEALCIILRCIVA